MSNDKNKTSGGTTSATVKSNAEYKDGDYLTVNGRNYQIVKGRLEEVVIPNTAGTEEIAHFYIVFDYPDEVSKKRGHKIDIFPYLEQKFGKEEAYKYLNNIVGIETETEYKSEDGTMSASDNIFHAIVMNKATKDEIASKIDDILCASVVNSKQLAAMERMAREELRRPFDFFHGLLW